MISVISLSHDTTIDTIFIEQKSQFNLSTIVKFVVALNLLKLE